MEKTFDFAAFKSGKMATNSLGHKVKFLCETRGQMLVSIEERFGRTSTSKYNLDGKKYSGTTTAYDLYMEAA